MKTSACHRTAAWLLVLGMFLGLAGTLEAREIKLEAQLVWGTNESKSPDPAQKPVTEEVEKRLKGLPLKWQHYYEVKRKQFTVAHEATKRTSLSKDCVIVVKNLDKDMVEVTLLGKGEVVGRIKQKLPEGETLVLGGNAANLTGWFVVLRQVK
jgi:hypothetical protein